MADFNTGVVRDQPGGFTEGSQQGLWLDKSGAVVAMDWITKLILGGHGYNVTAGTITAPLVGDVAITDAAAEMAISPASGMTAIPFYQKITINLGTGTLHEYASKSVAGAASAGDLFVPLPLNDLSGAAATTVARVDAAGGVTVTAELATTTRLHWSTGQPIAMGAYVIAGEWAPLRPPPILGGECFYTQIAATTTGPSYFANLDFVELATTLLG